MLPVRPSIAAVSDATCSYSVAAPSIKPRAAISESAPRHRARSAIWAAFPPPWINGTRATVGPAY